MADTAYGVTPQGFVKKPLEKIISDINAKFLGEFGSSFDVTPESPDGQIIGIVADQASICWELAQAAYNAYRPGATSGITLDSIVELNRITRIVDRPTQATCFLDGDAGLAIPKGSLVATNNGMYEFTTNNDITLPDLVTVTCTTLGENAVLANTITVIVNPIAGWTSVNNPEDAITGIDYESDPQLRSRRENSTIVSGTNTTEAIYDALSSMNLSYIRIRDNDSDVAVGTQPPSSFQTVVVGGTNYDIAKTIYDNKPNGIQAYGTTVVTVLDSKGYPHDIGFTRPANIDIHVDIQFRRFSGSSNDAMSNITEAVIAYISSLDPGESVIWSKLFAPITLTTPYIEIASLLIGTDPAALGTATIPMDIAERAFTSETLITIQDIT